MISLVCFHFFFISFVLYVNFFFPIVRFLVYLFFIFTFLFIYSQCLFPCLSCVFYFPSFFLSYLIPFFPQQLVSLLFFLLYFFSPCHILFPLSYSFISPSFPSLISPSFIHVSSLLYPPPTSLSPPFVSFSFPSISLPCSYSPSSLPFLPSLPFLSSLHVSYRGGRGGREGSV